MGLTNIASEARRVKAPEARNVLARGNAPGSEAPQTLYPTLDGVGDVFLECADCALGSVPQRNFRLPLGEGQGEGAQHSAWLC